jgi:N6-adenosine-specific RNA methylase IME4
MVSQFPVIPPPVGRGTARVPATARTGNGSDEEHAVADLLPIADIVVDPSRCRVALGDLDGLAASISAVGLLQPVVLRPDRTLVAGYRRLRACQRLGWQAVPVRVMDNLADALLALQAERDENRCRKDPTPSESYRESLRYVEVAKAEAERRRREHGGRPSEKTGKTPAKLVGVSARRASDDIAAAVGRKRTTLAKIGEVVEAAENEPGKYGRLFEQMERSGRVDGSYKRLKRLQAAEAIAAEPPPLPEGPFRVLVIDPPWHYGKRADDFSHRAAVPYPTMTMDEIQALDVPGIAHTDCVLWLWTTNAFMEQAHQLIRGWGFQPKSILTWVKDHFGCGDWLRGQTEHCLLAVRGRPMVSLTHQSTALTAPLREHSRKPDEFYALVESLCPGSKAELFAREPRAGWAQHGHDVAADRRQVG